MLALDLTDDTPQWQIWSETPASAPAAVYQTLSILSSNSTGYTALLFGGDVTGTSLPTSTDSSFLLDLPKDFPTASTESNDQLVWQHPPATWVDQPMRRIKAATSSIADTNWVYNYIFGGLKNDDSNGFNELWCFRGGSADLSNPSWQQINATGSTQPPISYGHTMTLLSNGGSFRAVTLGGQSDYTTLNSLDEIYIFTPGTKDRCSGGWSTVTPSGTAPTTRQGHVAVPLSSTEILIHGGASADEATVYQDIAILTFNQDWTSASWEAVDLSDSDGGPGPRYQHSAVKTGNQILFAFGYSSSGAASVADPGYYIYNINDKTWTSTYSPVNSDNSDNNASNTGTTSSNGQDSSAGQDTNDGNTSDSSGTESSDVNVESTSSTTSDTSSTTSDTSSTSDSGAATKTDSGVSDTTQDGGVLHTPGVGDASSGSDGDTNDNGSNNSSSSDSSNGNEQKEHTGVILGSVMSVFVVGLLAAGCFYWHRRRRQQTLAYYSNGGPGRLGDGSSGLISGADEDGFDEKAQPAVMKSAAPEGVKGAAKSALASMLGVGRRAPNRNAHRWDMLADEESNYSTRTPSQVSMHFLLA